MNSSANKHLLKLQEFLHTPVSGSTLAAFRMFFGAIIFWEVTRYWPRLQAHYISPPLHFSYDFFSFVQVWPEINLPIIGSISGMYIHFLIMGIASLGVMFGFLYRVSAVGLFLTFSYFFLLDKARYLNHFYLVALISFLMIFVRANSYASIDNLIWKRPQQASVPFWNIFILRAQIFLTYFLGGVAKINSDWLAAEPIGHWLQSRKDYPILGELFASCVGGYSFAYGGLLFDLSIGFLLLSKRTRLIGLAGVLLFNLTNSWIFTIGIFPWFMMAAAVLFFDPDMIQRLCKRARQSQSRTTVALMGLPVFLLPYGFDLILATFDFQVRSIRLLWPAIAFWEDFSWLYYSLSVLWLIFALLLLFTLSSQDDKSTTHQQLQTASLAGPQTHLVSAFLTVYLLFQVLIPLRHHLIEGDVAWTEEGHRFSWRMKLRSKKGVGYMLITDPATHKTQLLDPKTTTIAELHLTARQYRKMTTRPDMIYQYAQHLKRFLQDNGMPNAKVHAINAVSLNGRPFQFIVDPKVDLAQARYSPFSSSNWILSMNRNLPVGLYPATPTLEELAENSDKYIPTSP